MVHGRAILVILLVLLAGTLFVSYLGWTSELGQTFHALAMLHSCSVSSSRSSLALV